MVADGPRDDRSGEADLCRAARRVIDGVDWPCEVLREYSDVNLGMGRRESSGFTWAFRHVEEAILIEDDCLPDATFFPFCAELLDRYRRDERVMMISGDNFQRGQVREGGASYYFSRLPATWGWATWRRAWDAYDFSMREWPRLRAQGWIGASARERAIEAYWRRCFDDAAAGRIDTWDYQWVFSVWLRGGLSIVPNVNLVTNIGFRSDATNTRISDERLIVPTLPMDFPLRHPAAIAPCLDADDFEQRNLYRDRSIGWFRTYGLGGLLQRWRFAGR